MSYLGSKFFKDLYTMALLPFVAWFFAVYVHTVVLQQNFIKSGPEDVSFDL
jgi:hypothetical protein